MRKYQIRMEDKEGFISYPNIDGEKVIIAGFEKYSFFVHKMIGCTVSENMTNYAVSEETTGRSITSWHKTKRLAKEAAKQRLLEKGTQRFAEIIEACEKIPSRITYNICRTRTA